MSSKNKPESHQAMQYSQEILDFKHIVTLPQMRTEFDRQSLQELADSIARERSIINPQIVAVFSKEDFLLYAKFVCEVYQKNLNKVELGKLLKKMHNKKMYVMIAGERRLRASHILWNHGCTECREKNNGKAVTNGKCWTKHLGPKQVSIRVPITKTPADLLGIQLAENVHNRPSVYEEANAIAQFAVFLKSQNKNTSLEKIAKRMSRSPDTVRRALSFYALPLSIRSLVRKEIIRYGIATELARLLDKKIGYSEKELLREANLAMVDKKMRKVSAFANHVTGLIKAHIQKKNAQVDTLTMIFEATSPEKLMAMWLNPDAQKLARLLITGFSKALTLWESSHNKKFTKGRELSVGGFLEDYAKVIPLMERLLPHVERGVTIDEAREMRAGIVRIKRILKAKQKQLTAAV